jgi:transposase
MTEVLFWLPSPNHGPNGQTEGQITKLKLVKRQMHGRAKLDLLQARLIGAA